MKYGTDKECTHGCGSVAVSTVGCGPAGPGSIPGHGPILYFPANSVLFILGHLMKYDDPFYRFLFSNNLYFLSLLQQLMELSPPLLYLGSQVFLLCQDC